MKSANESIKIRFVIENESSVEVTVPVDASIMDAAKAGGVGIDAPCGGNGTCGKCKVKVAGRSMLACRNFPQGDITVEVPQTALAYQSRIRVTDTTGEREKRIFDENKALLAEEGFLTAAKGSTLEVLQVKLPIPTTEDAKADKERLIDAVQEQLSVENPPLLSFSALKKLPNALRSANFTCYCVLKHEISGEITIIDVLSGENKPPLLGLSIDIGTTTCSALLVNLETNAAIANGSAGNGQIRYGADVINRIIESTKKGGLEKLQNAIGRDCLSPLVLRLCARAQVDPGSIYRITVAGNTTMTHLFLGVDPEFIRLEPYVPAFFDFGKINAADTGLPCNSAAELFASPCVGSYVGGDITAGVLASRLYKNDELSLFIDLGTNGEIVFGNNTFMLACACSAGPAFEGGDISSGMRATNGAIEACKIDDDTMEITASVIGGEKAQGLCGSGLINIIAELFRTKIINAKGRFVKEGKRIVHDNYGGTGFVAANIDESNPNAPSLCEHGIVLWETDIDNFIRAKGAIFSAIRTMLNSSDFTVDAIEKVIVAGGIGSGINIESAIRIGMFPALPPEKYNYIGNSSLSGAYASLISESARNKIREIAGGITYLELSSHPSYMDEFVAACFLPHTDASLFNEVH
jgi:uncharacterized 2Fe-2S/4Fe-4S cluster protein (DUF4445 family)